MKTNRFLHYHVQTACAMIAGLILTQGQPARAGWTGSMNGTGYGFASVNVTSSTLSSNKVSSPNMTNPSAAMTNTATYFAGGPLPSGASPSTIARIKGAANYVWKATTLGSNGDKTDNSELEQLVNITPSECANVTMESSAAIGPDDKSGTITVNADATPGTAIWLRGFEYLGPTPPKNVQDLETNANSFLKWSILLVGPFDLNTSNCNAVIIPFTVQTSTTNLYFVTDGVAKSTPLSIQTPSDITVTCGQPVVYGPVYYSGCGDVTVSYYPPSGSTFPVGITPVTVTIADTYGNSTNATFKVTVVDNSNPVVPVLPVLTGQSSVQVPTPTTVDICGITSNTITGTTTDPTSYSTQGTNIVHWSFDDGNGNVSTASQTVIVKDTVPPVPPVLAALSNQCSVTVPVPTAVDAVAGTISGTTTDPLAYNTQGTFTVHWTFSDGNGNSSTANQTVIVKDTIAPAIPVLPTVTGSCSGPAVLTPPTATDNCAGIVTGTTTDPLIYSALGTNVVHWTFSDGNGNSTTANQTVIVTGLGFQGFYSPIGTVANTCTTPVVVNQGSVEPIKFEVFCGSTLITDGTPPVVEIQLFNNCSFVSQPVTVNAVYQNNWHYNWDTTGWAKGVYKVIVILPDGSNQYVFVKIK
jgi:hypothetical protein